MRRFDADRVQGDENSPCDLFPAAQNKPDQAKVSGNTDGQPFGLSGVIRS